MLIDQYGTMTSLPAHVNRISFVAAVVSGVLAAFAGASGWTVTSIVTGCIAAAAPIAGRFASQKLTRQVEKEAGLKIAAADAKADNAVEELNRTKLSLQPRRLSTHQLNILSAILKNVTPFPISIMHNRHEGEPTVIHGQLFDTFKMAGFDVAYYGGMTNSTVGIDVSGQDTEQKRIVMSALDQADIDFQSVIFTDRDGMFGGVEIWVGSHPGLIRYRERA